MFRNLVSNLPNLLTTVRLILVPFVSLALWKGQFHRAMILIFVAGLTDALDGFLARRFRWTSPTGAYLDPIADKALLVCTYLALGLQGAIPVWLVWIVLGRDAWILTMVAIAMIRTNVRTFPPSIWGKLSTAIQVFTALAVIADHAYSSLDYRLFETILIQLTAVATVGSGLHYTVVALRRYPSARAEKKSALSRNC